MIEKSNIETLWGPEYKVNITTFCVDGYKFIVAQEIRSTSIDLKQIFELRDGKSLPAKC
tara:strand:- start:333 stop:509 length:177 start_codon:yes stop_codon:yes gene_type:complete